MMHYMKMVMQSSLVKLEPKPVLTDLRAEMIQLEQSERSYLRKNKIKKL